MSQRTDLIRDEAAGLWREVFGEEPALEADGTRMLAIILAHLELRPYTRLAPARRARDLVFPRPEPWAESQAGK